MVDSTDAATLQGFVFANTEVGAEVYTDDSTAYAGMIGVHHETCKHSVGQWVNGMAHTNGLESFWSMFTRAYHGTYHYLSRKHLNRYVRHFAGKHNVRVIILTNPITVLIQSDHHSYLIRSLFLFNPITVLIQSDHLRRRIR